MVLNTLIYIALVIIVIIVILVLLRFPFGVLFIKEKVYHLNQSVTYLMSKEDYCDRVLYALSQIDCAVMIVVICGLYRLRKFNQTVLKSTIIVKSALFAFISEQLES
jgi:hypothetical protein